MNLTSIGTEVESEAFGPCLVLKVCTTTVILRRCGSHVRQQETTSQRFSAAISEYTIIPA